jgi:pimeloyl-ACP methyl ester carboxylesterase
MPPIEPILLLHGQPGSARDWDDVAETLRKSGKAIAVDRPGYDGRSAPGGIAHNAEAALALLDEAGIERAIVVGHSFGGAVAAWLAAHHPQRVEVLVLIAAAANVESLTPVDRILAAPLVARPLSSALLAAGSVLPRVGRLRRFVQRRFQLPDAYLDASAPRLRSRAVHRAFTLEQRAKLRELPHLTQMLPHILAPTMVIVGTADAVVPLWAGRRLAQQIPHARAVDVDGAGHLLTWTHGRLIAELIVRAATATMPGTFLA